MDQVREQTSYQLSKSNPRGRTEAFKENHTDLLQPHFETHRGMMVKREMISGLFQAIFKLYVPREESFPTPLKYIVVIRTTDHLWM